VNSDTIDEALDSDLEPTPIGSVSIDELS